jgi:raffinose/stachyose/melibiose transport system permease protein
MRTTQAAALRRAGNRFLYVLLVLFAFTQLFPLLWVFLYSLQKSGALFGGDLLSWPHQPQWVNYANAITNGRILRYGWNSVVVVTTSTIVSTVLSFCMAYAIARMQWKLKAAALSAIVMGLVIPIHTTLLPNFIWFRYFHLLDTRLGVIIPYIAFALPLSTLLFIGQFHNLPTSLEEAALIDGASWPRILWSVVRPLAGPAITTVFVMTFLTNWNEFIMANTYLATDDLRTLPFSIIKFQGEYAADYAAQFACMVMVALPPVILYLFFAKWIMAGATAGAIKG